MGTKEKPDILLFISDQHHAHYMGCAGHELVRTPWLDQLASEGTMLCNAYTASPLCVPSRVALLTGQLPSHTGVFTNEGAIATDQATFLHSIAAEGYDTVLCGRMHFMGEDQRHGFTKRIMGEMTPLFWGRYGPARNDLGPYVGTMANDSLKIVGGGTSPVLEYDKAVIQAALEYLQADHAKPQCIVVGTYGPHHTYVSPPHLYQYYKQAASVPDTFTEVLEHPVLATMKKAELTREVLEKLRAAYLGMVETMDSQLGEVRTAWQHYLQRTGRKGLFVYMSDHGEQAGEHGLIGKSTFYEGSAKIPVIVVGDHVPQGKRLEQPTSILDIGPTLCDWIHAEAPPRQDGISLKAQIVDTAQAESRIIISESLQLVGGQAVAGIMLRQAGWKFIAYAGFEAYNQLFQVNEDPQERHNRYSEQPGLVQQFEQYLKEHWNAEAIVEICRQRREHHALLAKWGRNVDVVETERWVVPEHAKVLPIV